MYELALILQDQPDPAMVQRVILTMLPFFFLFALVAIAIIVIPFWFICKKAGFSPWLSLLNIIPLGNLILIYVLAFSDWKVVPAPLPMWQPPMPQPPLPPQS